MQLKRIGIFSALKVGGALYTLMGVLLGGLFSLMSLVGGAAGDNMDMGILFGGLAIIVLPILYGVAGAISACIMAVLYNLIAMAIGGLELEFELPQTDVFG